MENNQFIELLKANYNKIVNYLGWSSDKRIFLFMASSYSIKGKMFSPTSFENALQAIRKQAGFFSTLKRSNSLLNVVAMMLDGEGDPEVSVSQLLTNKDILKKAMFKETPYLYIAALFLTKDSSQKEQHAKKAKKLYDEIRKYHPFLTSGEDVPYAVLMSAKGNGNDAVTRARTMKTYYDELREQSFSPGNHLQWLSQILTIPSQKYINQLVQYVAYIHDNLKQLHIKIKKNHYPLIGFLAIAKVDEEQLIRLVQLYNDLTNEKLFHWYKKEAFQIANLKFLHDLIDMENQVNMSLLTSLTMIEQVEILVSTAFVFVDIVTD